MCIGCRLVCRECSRQASRFRLYQFRVAAHTDRVFVDDGSNAARYYHDMDEKTLLTTVYNLAGSAPGQALQLANTDWPEIASRSPTPEDAETCRLAAVSAAQIEAYDTAALWRTRARSIAVAVPWPELIAAVDMAEAFVILARRNDDYARGRTLDVLEGSTEAIAIIQSLAPVADGADSNIRVTPKSPSAALIRRFILEKTASLQLAAGQWDAASANFAKAVALAESERGVLKSRGGLAIANYSRGLELENMEATSSSLAETRAVASEADSSKESDFAATARHNAVVMARGGSELLLYEIL